MNGLISLYGNRFNQGETGQCILTDFRMVKTQNEPWEKFTYGASPNPDYPQEINRATGDNQVKVVGKNLVSLGTQKNGYVDTTTSIFNDGSGGTSTALSSVGYYFETSKLPDTITISDVGGNRMNVCYFNEIPTNGTLSTLRSASNNNPRTIDVNKTYPYLHIQFSYNNTNVSNIQIESGSSATSYTPYESATYPISLGNKEMFSINGVYDGFVYDEATDKFYINRKIGKTSIIGSNVRLVDSYTNVEYGSVGKPNNFSGYNSYDQILVLCDKAHYFATSSWNTSDNIGIISGNADRNRWWIGFAKGTGLTNIQTSLDGSIIVYPLLTENPEEITDTTLISQLRAIKNALSMQGTTHVISTSSGVNLPFLIKARAVQTIERT